MEERQIKPSSDRLAWWEEIPLGLALLAQSYVVGLWYYASISGADWWVDLIVAVGAGLALDLIVVTTVMGRRAGRSSGWSWATSFGAFGCSSLIALDRYGWEWRSLLHVAFPLVVFLYSQHLATPRKSPLQTLPERLDEADDTEALSLPAEIATDLPVAPALKALDISTNGHVLTASAPLTTIVVEKAHRYTCPHCGQALATKQALGAAHKNGYCLGCKGEECLDAHRTQ
jgi:predicted RNA-binding Zn-ribbon protein involved in translation (DUF1610 family)